MKRVLSVFLSVILLCSAGCGTMTPTQLPQYKFAQVVAKPKSYDNLTGKFIEGTIVYEKTKDGMTILVVLPKSSISNKKNIGEGDVFPVRFERTMLDLKIGDVINVEGTVKTANGKAGIRYFIDAHSAVVIGKEDLSDPNFENIVKEVAAEANSDYDFIIVFFEWYILFSPALND